MKDSVGILKEVIGFFPYEIEVVFSIVVFHTFVSLEWSKTTKTYEHIYNMFEYDEVSTTQKRNELNNFILRCIEYIRLQRFISNLR